MGSLDFTEQRSAELPIDAEIPRALPVGRSPQVLPERLVAKMYTIARIGRLSKGRTRKLLVSGNDC
jgi:hypothetical protein